MKDADGKVLERAKTSLHIAPKNAGAGRELKLLIIGDSLTAATAYPNEIARMLNTGGQPEVDYAQRQQAGVRRTGCRA